MVGDGGERREEHQWPMWLRPLLSTSFFVQCKQHAAHSHRRECNMYCLDCTNGALCPLCVLAHRDHHAVQVPIDKAVVVPRRDQSVGDPKGARHHRRANIHHQQRPRRLPQPAPPAAAQQGRRQNLRGLLPQPRRFLPFLLPRMQARLHLRQ
ncbi:hypothetical protein ZIOFF_048203 [Zingiber officinale]|uniref:Uncharacterized protein n=1 Tax=Zingiber officinale TaxID=94328 RepID=A0A8J5FQB9_ZINOF|nr:hypothetical protein ZIOFF_048203 [Zingiber officinale]